MANIYPFRPWRYTPQAGPISNLVTQPYDTIPADLASRYRGLSPHNLVHLILPEDDYSGAAARFQKWTAEGILARDAAPALYIYEQRFRLPETQEQLVRRGFIGLSDTDMYGATVHRHELTLDAPRADRLALLNATRAQFGSIFMLYPDAGGAVDRLLNSAAGEPVAMFTDHQETRQTLWRVENPAWIAAIQETMRDKPLLIADGHHRYEAALQAGAPRTMMTFVPLESPGLRSLAAHRVVFELPASLPQSRTAIAVAELPDAWANTPAGRVRFGMADSRGLRLLELDRPPGELNLTVLHRRILQDMLGITPDAVARERFVGYRRGIDNAIAEVRGGNALAAFLVEPLRIEEVAALAFRGEILPQKSTDFYPKLLSGLTIYGLDD